MTNPDDPEATDPFATPTTPPAAPSPPPPAGQPAYGAPPPAYGAPPAYPGPATGYGQPQYGTPGPGQPASMGMRLVARIVDGILVFVVALLLAAAVGVHPFHTTTTNGQSSADFKLYGNDYFKLIGITLLLGIVYEVVLIAVRGATIGKSVAGVKVVRGQEGALPGFGPSFIRWVIPSVAGAVFSLLQLLIYISPFFDSSGRRRGWHDKAANTFVIRSR